MSFTGSPGTGKTTVALRMAEMLSRMGHLAKGYPDYSLDESMGIACLILDEQRYSFSEEPGRPSATTSSGG